MKKFILTLALLTSTVNLAYAADAASVRDVSGGSNGLTLYVDNERELKLVARVDSAMMSVSGVGTANKRATVFLNGGEKTSILGFKYKQYLGDDWETGLRYDSTVIPSDGSIGQSSATGATGNFWSQYAYWYLSNPTYGKLTMGRADGVAYTVNKMSDARPGTNFGGVNTFWTDNSAFGGTATTKTGMQSLSGGNQVNGLLRYDSPAFEGVNISLGYQPGGVADNDTASTKYDYAVLFRPKGNALEGFQAGFAQHLGYSSAGVLNARTNIVGGNYIFLDNKANVGANYITYENPSLAKGTANSDFEQYSLSAKYFITPKFDINGGWYQLTDNAVDANKATQWSLGAQYFLSKKVMLYVDYAKVDNQGGMGFAPYGPGAGNLNSLSTYYKDAMVKNAGQDVSAVMVGFQMEF
jgi:predicted porin